MARVDGVVVAQAPKGLYVVEIEGPQRITAHASVSAERNFLRLLVGDRVVVELMPQDRTRGRVVRKL
jgi:translation initiation factor IF-1